MQPLLALFLLAIAVGVTSDDCPPPARRCPVDYQLMARGRCIKIIDGYERKKDSPDNLLKFALNECEKDDAYPPIITNDDENDMFNDIAAAYGSGQPGDPPAKLLMGLVCDQKSRKLKWANGDAVTYTKGGINISTIDCTQHETVVSEPKPKDDWYPVNSSRADYNYTVMCATLPTTIADDPCGDYESLPKAMSRPCYKYYSTSLTWNCASLACPRDGAALARIESKDDNDFFRRTAQGNNASSGLLIGLYGTSLPTPSWKWIDDDTVVSTAPDKNTANPYTNFITGFPAKSSAQLRGGAMQTNPTSQFYWYDVDDNAKLPYVCRRDVDKRLSEECPTTIPAQDPFEIVPPGYPHPNISCEYTLKVDDELQLVRLQIDFFEANECCDYLEVYEGLSAAPDTLLAKLTGSDLETTTITTTNSNSMLLNWVPNGAVGIRGFRVKYKGVDRPPATLLADSSTSQFSTTL